MARLRCRRRRPGSDALPHTTEPSTLDVLGLGPVVGTFSGVLHPGTSYIHTNLCYFMFLPWIFQRLEADRVPPRDFFRRLRNDEIRLIDCLRHLGSGHGVIGYWAGRNLKRMPSSIYWGGLWDWGIRRVPLGLGEYAHRAAAFGRQRASRDDGNVTDPAQPMWAPIPSPPEYFLKAGINFDLRRDEAQALVDGGRLTPKHDTYFSERRPFRSDDHWDRLDGMGTPALLVHAADSFVNHDVMADMANRMSNATLVQVENSTHVIPVDNPAGLVTAIVPFL